MKKPTPLQKAITRIGILEADVSRYAALWHGSENKLEASEKERREDRAAFSDALDREQKLRSEFSTLHRDLLEYALCLSNAHTANNVTRLADLQRRLAGTGQGGVTCIEDVAKMTCADMERHGLRPGKMA